MGKAKKSVDTHLLKNTVAYGFLSVWSVIGSFFILYFTCNFANAYIGDGLVDFRSPEVLISYTFLSLGLLVCHIGVHHIHALYREWERKWAIDIENQRILRLSLMTSPVELEEELLEQAHQSQNTMVN